MPKKCTAKPVLCKRRRWDTKKSTLGSRIVLFLNFVVEVKASQGRAMQTELSPKQIVYRLSTSFATAIVRHCLAHVEANNVNPKTRETATTHLILQAVPERSENNWKIGEHDSRTAITSVASEKIITHI